ncbi:MAG: hypothetical protein KJ620_02070 [Candidatus Edwardsbacteria bacterium]|nr:hypothetical protein [Candidatus Edwardsbacteria bacterium]MBU1576671.1 hypothetical protein [Candidatus Edwardsbacteria bacterium]MBU2464199.1 hypothetical protein [Candidatus Edwardsbacteria bacterium]MBU2594499.1 hypothetical protein [Candidatus Edwardsbacteria bacterium]
MNRVRLCSHLLAGLSCWLFLSGCISVDIQTKAGRDLSGSRTYRITLEPMLARFYRSGAPGKMFDFPGQDLEKQKGVSAVSKQEIEAKDGSLELVWSYRSSRLDNFSSETDTVIFSKRAVKWWIYYSYYERYLPRRDTSNIPAAGSTWLKNSLTLPGQVYSSNGDSLSGSQIVWLRSMDASARGGLMMTAQSREINPLLLVLLPVFLGVIFYFLLKYRIKSVNRSPSAGT